MAKAPYRPLCNKCGQRHFNFNTCDVGPELLRRKDKPSVYWRTTPEGTRPWGDRLTTLKRSGTSLFRPR